jgi:ribosomal-protein-alanine N-acetyltransferase
LILSIAPKTSKNLGEGQKTEEIKRPTIFSVYIPKAVTILKIQQLSQKDLSRVLELDQLCFGGLWTREAYQRELDSPNSDLLGLWKEMGETVISPGETPLEVCIESSGSVSESSYLVGMGCLWSILDEAHITILGIDPHYQCQGLGQVMLYALLKSAKARQLQWATLEVRVSNQSAIALYRKFGFKDVGRRKGYYQDTGEDALILWRNGLNHPDFEQMLGSWEQEIRDRLLMGTGE